MSGSVGSRQLLNQRWTKVETRTSKNSRNQEEVRSAHATVNVWLGCDIGGAKELGVIYFPTNWGAKEPQNLPNHRVDGL